MLYCIAFLCLERCIHQNPHLVFRVADHSFEVRILKNSLFWNNPHQAGQNIRQKYELSEVAVHIETLDYTFLAHFIEYLQNIGILGQKSVNYFRLRGYIKIITSIS